MVKNLPAMSETWVQFLCGEDLLEKELATPSSILAWRISQTEEPGQPWGHKESDTTERLHDMTLSLQKDCSESNQYVNSMGALISYSFLPPPK